MSRSRPSRRPCAVSSAASSSSPAASGAAALLLAASGCGTDPTQPKYADTIALFGYLYVGETVSEDNGILVTRTRSIDAYYDVGDGDRENALVTLRREGAPSRHPAHPGQRRHYCNNAVVIDSLTTYHLRWKSTARSSPPRPRRPAPSAPFARAPGRPGIMTHSEIAESLSHRRGLCRSRTDLPGRCLLPGGLEDRALRLADRPHDTPQSLHEYGGDNGQPRHITAYFRLKNLAARPEGYLIGFYGDMMGFYGRYQVGDLLHRPELLQLPLPRPSRAQRRRDRGDRRVRFGLPAGVLGDDDSMRRQASGDCLRRPLP